MISREDFEENGYVLLKGLLPHDLIDQHLDAIQAVYSRHGAHHNVETGKWEKEKQKALLDDINDIHCRTEAALRLSLDSTLVACLKELFGDVPVRHIMRTHLWHAGGRGAHFDTSSVTTWPDEQVCRAWCALDDIHPDSGIFYIVPGSQKKRLAILDETLLESPTMQTILSAPETNRAGGWAAFRDECWPRLSEKMAELAKAMPQRAFALKKGDVLLFSPNAIHGTLPRTNADLPRKVMINEYRAKSAYIYFCSERFGSRFHAEAENYGVPADHGAMETPFGFINPELDWDWMNLPLPRLNRAPTAVGSSSTATA